MCQLLASLRPSEFFNDPRKVPATLDRHLFKGLLQIIPVRSAEAERGFSEMNIICAPLRSKITIPHLSSLMFVSINGTPMYLWNSFTALSEWPQKHVSALDNKTRKRRKVTTDDFSPLEKLFT